MELEELPGSDWEYDILHPVSTEEESSPSPSPPLILEFDPKIIKEMEEEEYDWDVANLPVQNLFHLKLHASWWVRTTFSFQKRK